MKLKTLITSAFFAALICLSTAFVKVPLSSVGYVHLGDTFIFLACVFLPTPYAVIASGLGSGLADILAGYVSYAPVTLFAKCAMAFVFSLTCTRNKWLDVLGASVASVVMASGYFVYEAVAYGAPIAAANIPFNLLQGGVCAVVALPVAYSLKRFWHAKKSVLKG